MLENIILCLGLLQGRVPSHAAIHIPVVHFLYAIGAAVTSAPWTHARLDQPGGGSHTLEPAA